MPAPIVKMTKTELLEEYNKLLSQHEELKRTAHLISDPQSMALLSKAEGYTIDQLAQSINALKSSVNATLNELADKLIQEAQKFAELQKAIEVAKKNLELHYHVQVTADTLERLIAENKLKTAEFEEDIVNKKRDWAREQEERDYVLKREAKRAQEEFDDLQTKQERLIKEREERLTAQEKEFAEIRIQVQEFPRQLEKALVQREIETTKRLRAEFELQMASAKKDWVTQENLYKLRVSNLEEYLKTTQSETNTLRQEAEKANKRAQELAVTIIESGSRSSPAPETNKEQKTSPIIT